MAPNGASIGAMYRYWVAGLLVLYPLCLWYGRVESRRPDSLVLLI